MKPDWDKLALEFEGSASVLVADVDCTTEGEDVCSRFGVSGYPTIKTFFADGEEPEDYKGGRDYASLVNHVEENLLIACLISDPDNGCSDKEKAYIEKMSSKSKVDVVSQLDRLSGMKNQSMKKELKGW
eukprot:CAMPEP_0197831268 /NCGR_PEP_ID=MMETSP1437-20131217/8816_1 /TAXON_ID=49252 ORGANISM="Eucampia antarctica, Strain CCMP1452" /NCGR_SAMPLE_ID=MMETSP1437 /ASSEMBLY_ACC=CAM_ASM_001096 /LENGTH=128 /DNA_ID=CAMNT_0043434123 /DNA_START=230 /DNA_END=613 /DNA_ORIENTATION=-